MPGEILLSSREERERDLYFHVSPTLASRSPAPLFPSSSLASRKQNTVHHDVRSKQTDRQEGRTVRGSR